MAMTPETKQGLLALDPERYGRCPCGYGSFIDPCDHCLDAGTHMDDCECEKRLVPLDDADMNLALELTPGYITAIKHNGIFYSKFSGDGDDDADGQHSDPAEAKGLARLKAGRG